MARPRRPSLGSWLILVVLGLLIAGFVPAYYLLLRHVPVWKLRTWMLIVPLLVAGRPAGLGHAADWRRPRYGHRGPPAGARTGR